MFDRVKALMSLIILGSQQDQEPSEGAALVLLKRRIKRLEIDLAMFKEVAKDRYALVEPLNTKIKSLQNQNDYLTSTNNLMKEIIDTLSDTLKKQSEPLKATKVDDDEDFNVRCRKEAARLYPTP